MDLNRLYRTSVRKERDALLLENELLREQVKVLREALKEAVEHLEWVGYGDSYERECAGESGLIDRLESALEQAKPNGEMEAKL